MPDVQLQYGTERIVSCRYMSLHGDMQELEINRSIGWNWEVRSSLMCPEKGSMEGQTRRNRCHGFI